MTKSEMRDLANKRLNLLGRGHAAAECGIEPVELTLFANGHDVPPRVEDRIRAFYARPEARR